MARNSDFVQITSSVSVVGNHQLGNRERQGAGEGEQPNVTPTRSVCGQDEWVSGSVNGECSECHTHAHVHLHGLMARDGAESESANDDDDRLSFSHKQTMAFVVITND